MSAAIAELPKVHGQHRNKALAAAQRVRAVELRTTGLTYDQIAAELGYANRGTVYRLVSEALETQTVEAVDQLRSLEVERLDRLQFGVWQKAMDGDVHAGSLAIRVIMARCRLLGLDGPSVLGVGGSKPQTVVVPPVD
jgi:hypothetical protein